jgi:hypothetical protein
MISDAALDALKARNPVHEVASQWVKLRRRGKRGYVGPCPMCSDDPRSRSAMRFECDADKWVCAVCQDGGDVIKLVRKREGIGFQEAVDRLGGGADERPTPELARRAGVRAFAAGGVMGEVPEPYHSEHALRVAWCDGWAQARDRDRYETYARERERKRLYEFLQFGTPWRGTLVEDYFTCRGVMVPANARLRFHPSMPMFTDGREREPMLVHRGPAMLAPFLDGGGIFRGLHITWIDMSAPNCKAMVHHPDTGEVLPSKKMRGTKAGCYLDLGGEREAPQRIVAGEGIETVAAVYSALARAGRDVSRTAFRASGDLGNLAGKATATIAHPTLRTDQGRARRVPGPDPDPNSPAMPVPDQVPELVLLGDGDSEPFLTRNALERASRRHAREGRAIRVRFAPAGLDFNDVMQGKANG